MCQKCAERPETFHATNVTVAQVKSAIPGHLFVPQTSKALYYLARDLSMMIFLAYLAWTTDTWLTSSHAMEVKNLHAFASLMRGCVWVIYWWFQSLTVCGLWLLAHECGHGAFSPYSTLNDSIGFVIHSFLGTPYYSWKYSHRQHHRYNGHLEKDEHFIPKILDANQVRTESELWDFIEDTPVFQLSKLVFHQLLGFPCYLLFNVSGQPRYPRWTSHFNPYCILFRNSQRLDIILSDIGLFAALLIFRFVMRTIPITTSEVVRLYVVPWVLLNHWVAMIVVLQHIDVLVPRYRDGAFTFARGALATIDRKFLGWQGKFFLHAVSHYHVVHHFFPAMPFYNLEEATQRAKEVLGKDYYMCDTPVFRALWENFLRCQFVDAKGDIVFYKDKTGNTRFRSAVEENATTNKCL